MTEIEETDDLGEAEFDSDECPKKMSTVPVWRVTLESGGGEWLSGFELLDSLCRHIRWSGKEKGYFEDDAAFLAYRNSLGRHCGKAADAALCSTPNFLARLMVKREQELYMPLKNRAYDNNWGGKSGARNAWINSLRDFCYDFRTARDGLLTLENAFFELSGGIPEDPSDPQPDPKSLLNDEATRNDIELETMDKSASSLWNSRESRAIFREIVNSKSFVVFLAVPYASCHSHICLLCCSYLLASTTTGVLALAFDLLCRNCRAYLDANKLSEPRKSFAAPAPMRMTRRMNAWQQANQSWYD
jgi:hypothetical protein